MRKIISKKKEAKKNKMKQLAIGLVLAGIMIFSLLGYSIMGKDDEENEKIVYNGMEFERIGSYWQTELGELKLSFKYLPNETKQINSIISGPESYANQPLYIYSEDEESLIEVYRNLFYINKIALRAQEACYGGKECEEGLPVKDCSENLIVIQESNSTGIMQQDKCVFIEGKKEDLTMLSDSFLYKLFGIQ